MLSESLSRFQAASAIEAFDPGAIVAGKHDRDELTLEITPQKILDVCRMLKQQERFVRLSSVTGVDWYPAEPRFEVVYHLHSVERNERLRLKCRLPGDAAEIDSVTGVWRSADWYERETFDLFGIRFRNHPDLRRLMMPADWQGHPLRKDYPVHGYRYEYQDESAPV